MANRRAMKLFAVAMLAGASTAHAETATQPTRVAGATALARSGVDWNGKLDVTALQPRLLANGRAACGNTASKQGYGMPAADDGCGTAEQKALLTASLAYQSARAQPVVINPRLLGNARPACGNTGGKADAPDDCTPAELRAVEVYDRESTREWNKHNAAVDAAYTTLVAATRVAMRADPTLQARLMANGRPACGNTMGKAAPPSYCREDGDQ